MQTSNDSVSEQDPVPQQDSDTPMAFYFLIGAMGVFAIILVLYVLFVS